MIDKSIAAHKTVAEAQREKYHSKSIADAQIEKYRMAQISMQETLAEAQRAITNASKVWRKKPEKAADDCRYARAMLITAEKAIIGELEISDK